MIVYIRTYVLSYDSKGIRLQLCPGFISGGAGLPVTALEVAT